MKPEQIKEQVIEAWRKRRVPSLIKELAEVYDSCYDKMNNEKGIIAFIPPRYLLEINYSYAYGYLEGYIDELTEEQIKFIQNNEPPSLWWINTFKQNRCCFKEEEE